MYKNILIYGHSNIGDTVYDLAVVGPLREAYPDSKITFLVSELARDIVKGYGGLDRIIVFSRHGKKKTLLSRLQFTASLRRSRFDLVIVLNNSLNYLFMGAARVWRVTGKFRNQYKHPVDRYINLLRFRGVAVNRSSFHFGIEQGDVQFVENLLREKGINRDDILIGIMPLAAWSLKSWPMDKWRSLAEILTRQRGVKVVNLGKMPNSDLGRRVTEAMSGSIISLGDMSLMRIKALLRRCRIFIGPDSSLLHLASCMGVETIGLYGATSIDHFYPYFHRHNSIGMKPALSCAPCCPGKISVCAQGGVRHDFGPCMQGIEVADVADLVKKQL